MSEPPRYAQVILALAIASTALRAQSPSQRELNGFLLGQHNNAIAASFTEVLRVDTTSDRWVYRTYLLDRARRAYMSFKFSPDHPDYAISVQVAGDSGTPIHPFPGLVLGDHRESVLTKLGKPSGIEHNDELNLDVYVYDGRNYSVELDSLGRLSSIQIFGYEGFPDRPPDDGPSLDSLAAALQLGVETTLQYLAPDLEIYREGRSYSFRRAALTDLQDGTSTVARVLFREPSSLAAVLGDLSNRSRADVSIRLWERRPRGWVWKLPAPAPIAEVVFVNHAGRWCVWEISYR